MSEDPSNRNTVYRQYIKHDSGEAVLEFPQGMLDRLGWKEGDDLRFEPRSDGGFLIRKIKLQSVSLDLDEKDLFKLMYMAHEKGITLDQLVQQVIEERVTSDGSS